MKFMLRTATPRQLETLQSYAFSNDKLLCLRDKQGRLLAVGKGLAALQKAKSKDGFYYYQSITKLVPVKGTRKSLPAEIVNNNFQREVVIYDVFVEVYEGKRHHKVKYLNQLEDYWFKCYEFYKRNSHKFMTYDLINKKIRRMKKK